MLCLATFAAAPARADDGDAQQFYAFGVGVERMPTWIGSSWHRNAPVPYFDIKLPNLGELSSTDGLSLDAIRGSHWHGGLYGNYLWGRSRHDLGPQLEDAVNTLSPRIHGGGYLEYGFTPQFHLGGNLTRDIVGTGAYATLYADYDLPRIGYWEHSLELQWQGMNSAAMSRLFYLHPEQMNKLGLSTQAWRPGAGSEMNSLEYDAFMPTSLHTGFAIAINCGYLLGPAASSPLVEHFGTNRQVSESMAFLYHF